MKPTPFSVRFLRLSLGMAFLAASALAQSDAPTSQFVRVPTVPRDRVHGPVTAEFTRLKGQTRPMQPAVADLGVAPDSMSTGRMVLWLRRSAEQQAQLSQFLSHAQDRGSATYRHWLTPESYGAAFGISEHDLAAVQQWLQTNGLTVERVSAARNVLVFSGTAGSLASAFHTSVHSYMVGKQAHFANATDPEIPTALAPVIAGVSPMNDFHAKPMHVLGKAARYDAASKHLQPAITVGDGNGNYSLYVTPADASIIYDTPNQSFNPAATTNFDGTGVTIGVLGYSALAMADVQNFRTAFLPANAASNLPKQILDGGLDPGVINGPDASESLLDVEVAGGLAPGARITYYYAASTDLSDGLILAGLRALEDNKVNILSVSYGQCESDLGAGGNLAWSELWQQAAAQGVSVVVSSGDSGSASCDADTSMVATHGTSVSGLASTPYNIAVGGTDFYPLVGNFSNYVSTASTGNYPYYATALSYIPETPWNDSSNVVGNSFTNNIPTSDQVGDTNIIGGGGGLSSKAICPGTINNQGICSQSLSGYTQPPYQTGFQAVNPVRSIPDVALLAANGFYGAAWVFCSDSTVDQQGGSYTDCQVDGNGHLINDQRVGLIGGTSASAPAFAGMLAMVSQSQGGARLGQADAVLYNLAQDYAGKYQQAFHDIAIGNNSVYCETGTLNCGSNNFLEGYNATPSYDMASGLGSVDLSQLISLWTATNFAGTSNALAAGISGDSLSTAPISVVHGTQLNFATTVTPNDATGQFSLVATESATAASFNDFGTLDGTATGNLYTSDLPGGTYTVYAYYAGDTSHTGSQSSNGINVTISAESSTTTLSFGAYDPTTYALTEGLSTAPYGVYSFVSAQPIGNNSTVDYTGTLMADGVATGSVTFTSNGKTQSAAINSFGVAQISASSFSPGTYAYQASYAGDASFAPSTSSPQTLTITKAATSFLLSSNAAAVTPTGQVSLTALLQTASIALYPTGTIAAAANGHSYSPVEVKQGQSNGVDEVAFLFSIPASDLAPGSNSISVSYGGDANYQSTNGSVSVTLIGIQGSYTLSGPGQPVTIEASQLASTSVSVSTSNGFTGVVNMACVVSAASAGHTPTCQGAPATVYGNFGATSAVSVAAYADTPAGTYTMTVTGTNGQQSQSVQIPLQVTAGPNFTLAAANSALSIAAPGQGATDLLTLSPIQGFTGTAVLSCIVAPLPTSGSAPACGLPSSVVFGASASTATLQLTSDSATPAGAYSVAVTAVSGGIQQTLTVPFTIQQLSASPTFGLSAGAGALSISIAGQSVAETLTINPAGGFTGTIQLNCAVAGATFSSAGPTCVVPATALVAGSSPVNVTLIVNTTAASAALAASQGRLFGERLGGLALGCLLLFAVPRRRTWAALGLVVLAAGSLVVIGCGGNSSSGTGTVGPTGTPAGKYTVTVTAASGSLTTTTLIAVTVQ